MTDTPDNEQTIHLVLRAQDDDEAAREALFSRFWPRVRRIVALRLGKNPRERLDTDDITQEALMDAFRGLSTLDIGSDGKLTAWLARIVENRIRMTLRSSQAQKRGEGAERRFADSAETIRVSRLPGDDATPSQFAMNRESHDRIADSLLLVPERYREVIIHRYICEMSYAEIAEELGFANADAARAMYSKALRELRRAMPDEPEA